MSTRSTNRQRTHTSHAHTSTIPTLPLSRATSRPGSSRPGTPSARGDIPSRKSSTNLKSPPIPSSPKHIHHHLPMSEHPATPTPRKRRQPKRGAKVSQQRIEQVLDADVTVADETFATEFDQNPSTDDEETLFDLLGVTSPPKLSPKRGVLSLSKDDMDAALGRKSKPKPQRVTGRDNAQTDSDVERVPRQRHAESPAPNKKGGRGKSRNNVEETEERGVESEGGLTRERPAKGRKGKNGNKALGASSTALAQSDGDGLLAKPKQSGISASRPKGNTKQAQNQARFDQSIAVEDPNDLTFDTASLSQSLPSQGLAQPAVSSKSAGGGRGKSVKKFNGSGDEGAVWEMPEVAGGQELTWQQKLQGGVPSDSPRKNNKPAVSEKKPKMKSSQSQPQAQNQAQALPPTSMPSIPRPAHNRRASLDAVPTSNPVVGGRLISAFDSHIPFHTGYNVHRAPQTPARGVAAANGNISNGVLPIVGSGEFPRMPGGPGSGPGQADRRGSAVMNPNFNSSFGMGGSSIPGSGAGPKYAGPTFHNSPAAATLSKPDLEDF